MESFIGISQSKVGALQHLTVCFTALHAILARVLSKITTKMKNVYFTLIVRCCIFHPSVILFHKMGITETFKSTSSIALTMLFACLLHVQLLHWLPPFNRSAPVASKYCILFFLNHLP